MPDNALTILESQLAPLAPRFEAVLDGRVTVARLIQTIIVSVERLPKLLECDRQSLFNAAMSAAVLGLEVDGVTGQAFLIPFKNRAQLVIGYKGYNTLGARSGITITGAVVREGDEFAFALGSNAFVNHVPSLNNIGRITAAWAVATTTTRPAVPAVIGIAELLKIKARAPGGSKPDSPWNDPDIGFPAMCEKTAKRRLARSMPLNVMQVAARMDEAVEEQGRPAWLRQDGALMIDGIAEAEPSATPSAEELTRPTHTGAVPSIDDYCLRWLALIETATTAAEGEQLTAEWNGERERRRQIWAEGFDERFAALHDKVKTTVAHLKKHGQ